ncbi:MAG: LPS-assembly lipoprotein [Alphaproteobacteria bacterium]|jgi:LPS-assembly lipoprotein|nr:LPS-assembly lipoprotein [Alphaproteobacteria bacterium]MEA3027056.1 LPS-assembly lipoprotein [Alphaproteobacteria bacterium]
MWWHERRSTVARFAGPALALALGSLVAGCFEPLYGEKTLAGGPGLRQRLSSVAIDPIQAPSGTPQARIAVELQNDLIFDLTGGAGQLAKTHQLRIQLVTQNQQVIVDIQTARADVQQFGLNATYTLVETATGRPVMTGQTFARVSYDNPGQQQRFANSRGQRDAENRAAKVISDNIKSRLASYFAAGA